MERAVHHRARRSGDQRTECCIGAARELRSRVRKRATSALARVRRSTILDAGDLAVFRAYGEAMLAAQLLEFTIFQLAHLERNTPADLNRALRQIEGLLRQPAGDQIKTMGDVDPLLFTDLRDAISVRNMLAHEFLLRYRVEKAVNDEASEMAVSGLTAMRLLFGDVQARLNAVADERLSERGIKRPYLSDEEMDELMMTLRRWAERDDEVENPTPDDPA